MSEYGLGYQVPLGLVMVGGPLVDAGFNVKLIDADVEKLTLEEVQKIALEFDPQLIGISHTGSTAAHLEVVKTVKGLKNVLAGVKVVYGGVYPTFAFRSVMGEVPEIDYIVRGEGEETAVDLAEALRDGRSLSRVPGIVWREDGLRVNKTRPQIEDLDRYRPGWELVNWDNYYLLGQKAAGVQFARGCPNSCGFCGQWVFWRRYRHRSPENFVGHIEHMISEYDIGRFWPADEHFTADREALEKVLNLLISKGLRPSMSINASVDSIIRDHDILDLYKRAGIDFIAMGVESDDDGITTSFEKSDYDMACEAVRLLRKAKILSCVNVIYGLEDESWKTIIRKARRLGKMDPDFVNATYLTPHFWTRVGSKMPLERLIQPDPAKWGYRNQVVHTPNLSPRALFLGVKATEFFLHGRPKRVFRAIFPGDKNIGGFGRKALIRALIVWMVEIFKDFPGSKFIKPGEFGETEALKVVMPRNRETAKVQAPEPTLQILDPRLY